MRTSPVVGRGTRRISLAAFLSFAGITFLVSPAQSLAVDLHPGDIVIATAIGTYVQNSPDNKYGLVRIDPVTGDRTIISDDSLGSGPSFSYPTDIDMAPNGDLLVINQNDNRFLLRVDPATGNRTVVSGNGFSGPGAGPNFSVPYGISQLGNQILVSYSLQLVGRLGSVDPASGNRTILSGYGSPGAGPVLKAPVGLAVAGNDIFVADFWSGVFKVNSSTGDRSLLTPMSASSGMDSYPVDLVFGPLGDLFLSARGGSGSVYLIDTVTGHGTIVSGPSHGTGPLLDVAAGIGVAADDTIFVGSDGLNAVVRVDPVTGDRTILSDASNGAGPAFANPQGLLVVPSVPEPPSLILAILAVASAVVVKAGRRGLYPAAQPG